MNVNMNESWKQASSVFIKMLTDFLAACWKQALHFPLTAMRCISPLRFSSCQARLILPLPPLTLTTTTTTTAGDDTIPHPSTLAPSSRTDTTPDVWHAFASQLAHEIFQTRTPMPTNEAKPIPNDHYLGSSEVAPPAAASGSVSAPTGQLTNEVARLTVAEGIPATLTQVASVKSISWADFIRGLAVHCKETLFVDRVRLLVRVAERAARAASEAAKTAAVSAAADAGGAGGTVDAGRTGVETVSVSAVAILVLACWCMGHRQPHCTKRPTSTKSSKTTSQPVIAHTEAGVGGREVWAGGASEEELAVLQAVIDAVVSAAGKASGRHGGTAGQHQATGPRDGQGGSTGTSGATSSPNTNSTVTWQGDQLGRYSSSHSTKLTVPAAAAAPAVVARISPHAPESLPSEEVVRFLTGQLPALVDVTPAFLLHSFTAPEAPQGRLDTALEPGDSKSDAASQHASEAAPGEGAERHESSEPPPAPAAAGGARAGAAEGITEGTRVCPHAQGDHDQEGQREGQESGSKEGEPAAAASALTATVAPPVSAGDPILLSPPVAWLLHTCLGDVTGSSGSTATSAAISTAAASSPAPSPTSPSSISLPPESDKSLGSSSGPWLGISRVWLGAQNVYKSSLHGRGMRRFMSRCEGYAGPWLLLVLLRLPDSSSSSGASDSDTSNTSFAPPLVQLESTRAGIISAVSEDSSSRNKGSVCNASASLSSAGEGQAGRQWLVGALVAGGALKNSEAYYGDNRSSALLQLLPSLGVYKATGEWIHAPVGCGVTLLGFY